MATAAQCRKQLVKIAENNVELQYYLLSPATLERVVLPEYTISYGQTKIDSDRATADSTWQFWNGLDAPSIASIVSEALDNVTYFDKVQDVMNAADGTIVDVE